MQELKVQDGHFVEVNSDMLDAMTRDGWKLVMVLPCTLIVDTQQLHKQRQSQYHQGSYENYVEEHREYGNGYRYLLHKSENEVRQELLKANRDLLDTQHQLRKQLSELGEEKNKVVRDHGVTSGALDSCRGALDESRESARTWREKTQKMELDLGKIREAIGSEKFNSIVGEKK